MGGHTLARSIMCPVARDLRAYTDSVQILQLDICNALMSMEEMSLKVSSLAKVKNVLEGK